MFRDVSARSEQTLLFTRPEADADGAARFDAERLQDAHGFHANGTTGGVIRGAGSAVPGIHVCADHHHFVFQVSAGDFGNRVVSHRIVIIKLRLDVHFHFALLS